MTTELKMLSWTLVLALVQIILPSIFRTGETGMAYNASPRDEPASRPAGVVTGRLMRAQTNLLETLPVFIAAVMIVQLAGVHSASTASGAVIYFWARVIYVPLYAFGIPFLRSLAWLASIAGIIMLLAAALA